MSRSSVAACGNAIMDHPIPNEQHFVASTVTSTVTKCKIPETQAQFKWKIENLRRFVEFASGILPTQSAEKYLTAGKLHFWGVSELIYDETKIKL